MTALANVKMVAGAVLCGTGATAGIALYEKWGNSALQVALGMIVLGVTVAAWPIGRKR